MSYLIDVQNDAGYPVDADRLHAAAEVVLVQESAVDNSAMTIVLTDDAAVMALNQQYRDVDAPTDVLSFPADQPELPGEGLYLGDLVIAVPYATAQADREGHDHMASYALLVVHGTLHLMGYDHDTPERRHVMWAAQDRALETLGIPTTLVPALEQEDHDGQTKDLD
jgi:probable rRNA maturation factor